MADASAGRPPLVRLSVMMFLQYAIWGAWLPILYPYLLGHVGFSQGEVGAIFSVSAVGAIIGPFLAGQFADRRYATEGFLAASHLVGAVLAWFLSSTTAFVPFLAIALLYGIVYAPTIALTNSLAFHHIADRDRDFGRVRVWGTVGWIAAGIGFGHFLGAFHTPDGAAEVVAAAQDAGRSDAFRLSALLGVLMAAYCLTLPHTPPAAGAGERNATFEALGEAKRQPLLTLFLLAVPVSIIHQFYFVHTADFLSELQLRVAGVSEVSDSINAIFGVGGGGLMTIGQMVEIAVLATIPFIAKSVSRKTLLAIGLAAYAGRMALFAHTDSMAPILLGVMLHGLCFGCFIFVAFMVVDEETTADVKASAQNLFNLVIVGIGVIVGSWFATKIVAEWAERADGTMDYERLFSVPMWMAVACLVLLLAFYPGGRRPVAAPAG